MFSLRCLIYKVHAVHRRVLILPHSNLFVKNFFQILFNLFLRGPARFSAAVLNFSHISFALSRTFFEFFQTSFVLSSAALCARRLSATLICYHIFLALSRTFFELLSRSQSPQLRFPCDNPHFKSARLFLKGALAKCLITIPNNFLSCQHLIFFFSTFFVFFSCSSMSSFVLYKRMCPPSVDIYLSNSFLHNDTPCDTLILSLLL